jgi:hypothetical protein
VFYYPSGHVADRALERQYPAWRPFPAPARAAGCFNLAARWIMSER